MKTLLSIAIVVVALACNARAHEGPEHDIEELTERMKKTGETAELLAERAVEYRVLGKLPEAAKDLERAVVLDPKSLPVRRELARVLFLAGRSADALAEIASGLKLEAEDPADTASLYMLRAEIQRSLKQEKQALGDCDSGLKLHPQNPEWYLLRSDIQRRLKMHKERIAGLEAGIKETGAGVLEIERVEAMIDAGQAAAALRVIEAELADSRIKSSWLIRRARAVSSLGRKADAEADLRAALAEIEKRLNPKTPDVPLLLDKALVHELLGEEKDALRAYEEARDKGAGEGVSEKVRSLRESVAATEKKDGTK